MTALKILLVLSVVVVQRPASSAIIDPNSRPDALIDSLAKSLDSRGIDVRRSWQSKASGPTQERAHLGRLEGYTRVVQTPPIRYPWMTEFVNSNGALLAVENEKAAGTITARNLRSSWNAAPQEKRVFVSFTREDSEYANRVASVLRSRGYAVFVYINSEGATPSLSAASVRTYFDTAGHRLVIDTPQARSSLGVQLEAHAAEAARKTQSPAVVVAPPRPGRSANSGQSDINDSGLQSDPCCKLCTYRNGVLIGCGPVECGRQCYAAK
jgi:hypothetical protein